MYSDPELRVLMIPHAIQMLSSDVFANQRNTSNVAMITQELLNIVKFGTPSLTRETGEAATTEVASTPVANTEAPAQTTFA